MKHDAGARRDAHHALAVVGGDQQAGDSGAVAARETPAAGVLDQAIRQIGRGAEVPVDDPDHGIRATALLLGERRVPVGGDHPVVDLVTPREIHQPVVPGLEELRALAWRQGRQGCRLA